MSFQPVSHDLTDSHVILNTFCKQCECGGRVVDLGAVDLYDVPMVAEPAIHTCEEIPCKTCGSRNWRFSLRFGPNWRAPQKVMVAD